GQQPRATRRRFWSFGAYGAISGANTAATMKTKTRNAPRIAAGLRRSRRNASRHSPPVAPSSATSCASSSATLTPGASRVADPRVDDRVREVDDQVHEHEDEGEEEDPTLEDGVVAVEDRVPQPRPHPRVGEDGLRQHRAREQQARLEADDRRDRKERVPQDVAAVDRDRRQALRVRRPHVVLVLEVEHGRARDARDDGERNRAERDPGQDQVLEHVPERVPIAFDDRVEDVEVRRVLHVDEHRDPADSREPREPHREDVLEDDREEEDRDRYPEQGGNQAQMVEDPAVALRRQEAERDAEEDGEEHRRERELHRRREALLDLGRHPAARGDADPEVSGDRRLQVRPVLDVDGLVEAVALAVRLDESRRRALTEERLGRAPWERPDPEEDQERDAEEDRGEQEQPADEIPKHSVRRLRRSLVTARPRRTPGRTGRFPPGSACSPAPSSGRREPESSARTERRAGTS